MMKNVALVTTMLVFALASIGAAAAADTDLYDPDSSNNQASVTVTPYSEDTNQTDTVPMQPTGVPLVGGLLAISLIFAGVLLSKRM